MKSGKHHLLEPLIGCKVKVVKSFDPCLRGLTGEVLDETLNTITLNVQGKRKMLQKTKVALEVCLPSGEMITVDGVDIITRPEDHLKKRWRKD